MTDHKTVVLSTSQSAETDAPCLGEGGKRVRNRLSAAERKAKLESIKTQYRAGHPLLVIRLNLGLREEQLSKMLAELFMAGELTPIASTYEVLSVSQAIKNIPGFTVSADGYVRVTKTDSGVVLTSYIADGDEHGY